MSKCLICGNELVTGDIHWEQGMCNVCWNKIFNKDIEAVGVDLIDIYKDKILVLEQQLAEKDNLIKGINQAYIETYKREREKDKEIEKLKAFMDKWHFKDFEDFEKHYNYLMSLKNREQLMVENEAMKETIANLLGQKKTSSKAIRKQVCNKVLELCDEKFRSINEFDFVEVISRDELIEVLDYIEGAE